jgi:hypothetical protein
VGSNRGADVHSLRLALGCMEWALSSPAARVVSEQVRVATVPRGLRQSWFRGLVVGSAVLLSIGVAMGHSLSAPSLSGRPYTYVVINPLNGRVIASFISGGTVTLNAKTGLVVKASGPKFISGGTVTLNPKTGQIVKVSS